jgi:hypothetical protein
VVDNGHERQRYKGRGKLLNFGFMASAQKFTVKELKPGKRVVWKSPKGQGADEWEEAEVTFDLSTDVG